MHNDGIIIFSMKTFPTSRNPVNVDLNWNILSSQEARTKVKESKCWYGGETAGNKTSKNNVY